MSLTQWPPWISCHAFCRAQAQARALDPALDQALRQTLMTPLLEQAGQAQQGQQQDRHGEKSEHPVAQ